MKIKRQILASIILVMAFWTTACAPATSSSSSAQTVSSSQSQSSLQEQTEQAGGKVIDPSGLEVTLPDQVNTIGVLAPSFAQTLIALGEGDKIVVCDAQSDTVEGISKDIPRLDLMNPDMEQLLAIKPDIVFVTNMTLYDGTNPFQQLIDAGVAVVCVPTSESLEDIQQDIEFIAKAVGKEQEGKALVETMQKEIDAIAEIGKTVTEKKKVYFEISPAPDSYSFGSDVFLNEMIKLIGAENVLADQSGWLPVDAEAVVAANPDVILTNVNYLDDAVAEILNRSGWENTNAVKNKQVFYIDNMASSLPNENVVVALKQMAQAIYPELYK